MILLGVAGAVLLLLVSLVLRVLFGTPGPEEKVEAPAEAKGPS